MQLYMSTSCQPCSRVIRAFSDVEKPFFIFYSEKAQISSRVNSFIDLDAGNSRFVLQTKTMFCDFLFACSDDMVLQNGSAVKGNNFLLRIEPY